MNELEALKAELAPLNAEYVSLGNTITADKYEPTAEETAKFDELHGKVTSLQEKISGIQSKMGSEREKNDRLNHFKAVRETQAKIDEFTYRAPNDEATYRGADQNQDFAVALAAWSHLGCVGADVNVTQAEVDAGRRLGVNVAATQFRITNPDVLRSATRGLARTYARFNSQGISKATLMMENDYLGAETDAMDSRVPERAGYLNRYPEVLSTLEMNMVAYGGILTAPITIMVTEHYEDVIESYGDDTTHSGRQIGEGQTIGTTLNPNFGNITWKAWDYTSDDILVNNRQLERSRYNLPSYIPTWLGVRLGRIQGTDLTTGTGANKPQGILTASTAMGTYTTSAVTAVVGYDDLVNTQAQLDPAMWNLPSTGWMMHPKALPLLKLIKDGIGNPILNLGKEGSRIATLMGDPIYWNNAMTAPTSGAWVTTNKAAIHGDLSRYVVRRAGGGIPVLIRDETTNRRTLQTIFTALINLDGRVRDYGTNPFGELRVL